jgi:glycosyltransferase involved in cell wall biosynthesis
MMRVLMFGPALAVRGGISSVERVILPALPRDVVATHIATMVEGTKATKLLTFLRALAQAWRQLGQRPDIVHIHFASRASSRRKLLLARLALARGCKVVMHAHGGGYMDYWNSLAPRDRRRVAGVLRRVHVLIVLGERWREFFASIGVPRERIAVFSNPVALPPTLPRRTPRDRVTFAFLGLIGEAKGAFDLVEALAQLPAETRARVKVVFAGTGALAELRSRIRARGVEDAAEVRGWLAPEERDRLLASADAFALPSHREALPMALLEAMAWGLPAICTPVGSIPEVACHEGNALIVPVRDPAALAAALGRLATDHGLRARMGAAARSSVEGMAVEAYVAKLRALYEDLACAR